MDLFFLVVLFFFISSRRVLVCRYGKNKNVTIYLQCDCYFVVHIFLRLFFFIHVIECL